MGINSTKSVNISAYQLQGVAQTQFKQQKDYRRVDAGSIEQDTFAIVFLDKFFLLELRESKVQEFKNLNQGNMSVKEYSLKFPKLERYSMAMVVDSMA